MFKAVEGGWRVLVLGLLALLALLALPIVAQDDALPLDRTYDNGTITFDYPQVYNLNVETDTEISFVNRLDAIGVTEETLQSGQFVIRVLYLGRMGETPYERMQRLSAEDPRDNISYGEIVETDFDGRAAALGVETNSETGARQIFIMVDIGGERLAVIGGLALADEIRDFAPTLLAIAETLRISDARLSETEPTPDVRVTEAPTPVPRVTEESPVDEADSDWVPFTTEDGALVLEHPAGWFVQAFDDPVFVLLKSAEDVPTRPDDIGAGELVVLVLPDVDTTAEIMDYPGGMDANTVPSTIVSFFASMGMVTGYDQVGAMDAFDTEDGRAASSSYALATGHERVVMSVEDGAGDIITIVAWAANGEMEAFLPLLRDMVGRMGAG